MTPRQQAILSLGGIAATVGVTLIGVGVGTGGWAAPPTIVGYVLCAVAALLTAALLVTSPPAQAEERKAAIGEGAPDRPPVPPSTLDEEAPEGHDEPPTALLEPMYLRGRIYPYMYSPVVDTAEPALAMRAAFAARLPSGIEAGIGSAEQAAFESGVAGSSLERWLLDVTSLHPRLRDETPWRCVDPTMSWIVTLRRPPVEMEVRGWTIEGRSAVSTRPFPNALSSDVVLLHADVVLRPLGGQSRGRPLSLEDLYAAIYALVSTLLDELAPAVLPKIVRANDYEALSFGCIVIPNADSFSTYVPLDWHGGRRADDAYDVAGAEWYPASLSKLDAENRAETIRSWIGRIIRDSGYYGYEDALSKLQPPRHQP